MIDKKLVLQALKVLRDVNEKFFEDSSKKKPLLSNENESPLYLQVQLKKIPHLKLLKKIKVHLPHSLVRDTTDVCLIAGDLDKRDNKAEIDPDILHYKELLQKHGISCISEVVTLRQLRTEYKPYEAKLKLLAAYDIFLNDNHITECLPKVLGRHFLKKKKFPIQINLKTSNLKQQVEKALSTVIFYISGHGNSCTSQVAFSDMEDSEIVDNILAVADALSNQLPGSWDNVMGVYLKTSRSKAIPIYVSYDDPGEVEIESEAEDDSYEIDELSTFPNKNVKVHKNGRIEVVRIKNELKCDEKELENKDEKEKIVEEKPKRQRKKSLLTEEKNESFSPSSKKLKTEVVLTKKLDCSKESKKNKKEIKLMKQGIKSQSTEEKIEFSPSSKKIKTEVLQRNDCPKEDKISAQHKKILLTKEKIESFSPSSKKKKTEKVQRKKPTQLKENRNGKKKKSNHL